jgi:hypothetical protein
LVVSKLRQDSEILEELQSIQVIVSASHRARHVSEALAGAA